MPCGLPSIFCWRHHSASRQPRCHSRFNMAAANTINWPECSAMCLCFHRLSAKAFRQASWSQIIKCPQVLKINHKVAISSLAEVASLQSGGLSDESPSTSRILLIAVLRLCSTSTKVSGQSRFCNSSRVTISPGCSRSMVRTLKGLAAQLEVNSVLAQFPGAKINLVCTEPAQTNHRSDSAGQID